MVERLASEIRAQRQRVQVALEYSLQAGRYDGASGSKLYQIFASFHGTEMGDWPS
jgi:hypothetical protein